MNLVIRSLEKCYILVKILSISTQKCLHVQKSVELTDLLNLKMIPLFFFQNFYEDLQIKQQKNCK